MPLFLPLMSLWFFYIFFFFLLLFYLFFFLSLVLPSFYFLFFTIHSNPFYIICHGGIYYSYPSTAFGFLWVSFQDCPLACQLRSYCHCSKCVGCTTLYSRKKLFVLFLTSLCFFTSFIWIRIKPLHYLPLWHASSGPSPYLPLLGEIPSQQDVSPQRSLSENPKIDPLFLPIPDHTLWSPWPVAHLPCIGWL